MAIHVWQLATQYSNLVCNATDFQYLAFSSLDKHDDLIATTVESKENVITKYVGLAKTGNKCT